MALTALGSLTDELITAAAKISPEEKAIQLHSFSWLIDGTLC